MLEAMAAGRTVISTDAGGIKEVIRHEVDGFLCAVDEPGRLVEVAVALLNDPDRRRMIGLNGRKRIQDKFSMEKMVGELQQIYLSVARKTSVDLNTKGH
jgi:glycosyltransferase involved in cell wall biosynthesis